MKKSTDKDEMTWQWKARVILFYITLTFSSILFVAPLVLLAILGFKHKQRYNIAIAYSWAFLKLAELICNIKFEVEWDIELPERPYILMANHQSFLDNIFMPHFFPRQSWVIKKELYNIPLFGFGLRLLEPIAVDRSDNLSVSQILNMGALKLQEGLCVVIFPEATRLRPGSKARMKPVGTKLAQMNDVPIVLIAHNAGLCWPKGFWIKKSGTVTIKVGKVLNVKPEDDVRKVTSKIEDWINTEKDKLLSN